MDDLWGLKSKIEDDTCLNACVYTYINLLAKLDNKNRFACDEVLADLRNAIASKLSIYIQVVQESAEGAAILLKMKAGWQMVLSDFCKSLLSEQ